MEAVAFPMEGVAFLPAPEAQWIAMLLLKWLHHLSQANWSLSNLATMLRLNLFTYRDLREWLRNPFGTPPILPAPEQLPLPPA